jgi:hypothetical protein
MDILVNLTNKEGVILVTKWAILGCIELAPTGAARRMDDKWSEKKFSVGFWFLG